MPPEIAVRHNTKSMQRARLQAQVYDGEPPFGRALSSRHEVSFFATELDCDCAMHLATDMTWRNNSAADWRITHVAFYTNGRFTGFLTLDEPMAIPPDSIFKYRLQGEFNHV